jgi:hypothetical protein
VGGWPSASTTTAAQRARTGARLTWRGRARRSLIAEDAAGNSHRREPPERQTRVPWAKGAQPGHSRSPGRDEAAPIRQTPLLGNWREERT